MTMQFEPKGHRVLIKPIFIEQKSEGGLILETGVMDKEDSELAEIVKIGSQAWKEVGDGTPWVKVGDRIVIKRYAGMKMPNCKELLRIINDEDVIALIEEE